MTVWERAVAALAARALDGGLLDSLREESLSALSPEDAAARKARRTLKGRLTGRRRRSGASRRCTGRT